MDDERTAAPSRPPSQDDGRIAWPFGPGFPSSGPQRTPPTGAFRCADPDEGEGLTALDTVGRQAMSAQTEQRPAGRTRRSALRAGDPAAEVIAVARDSGRELAVAEVSGWAGEQFLASGDPLAARMGRRLFAEVRD